MKYKDSESAKQHGQKFRLRSLLVVPFVVQIAATVGLVGYLSFRNSQQTITDLATQLSNKVTREINQHLESYLEKPHLVQGVLASAFRNGNLDPNDLNALERQFWSDIQLSGAIDYIYIGKEDGEFLGVQKYLDGRTVVKFRTEETAPNRLVYELQEPGDRTELLQTKEYDPRVRPWYEITLDAGEQTWSPIFTSANLGVLQISPTTPLYDSQGEAVGVLATNLLLAQLNNFLNKLQISQSGEAFIFELNGNLIASSTEERPSREVAGEEDPVRLNALESQQPVIQATIRQLLERTDLYQIQEPLRFSFELNDKNQLVQITPLEGVDGLDWLIAVVVPEADFMGQIYANNRRTFMLSLDALGVAIALGILTAHWITRPVLKITQASEEMAAGQLNQQVAQTSRIVEMEKLADTFNSMAGQLKESFETLEDKVEERTAELAQANAQITALNAKLAAENLRLGAELDVARQMQQMILPTSEELQAIEGLDIAGYMEPADEVGGDYYDVLYTDGIVTIGIGDVTGHGLESGILMVMTQTAVRTLKEIREADPVRFLDALNRTIYQNVQRMNSDKNLTLSILNYADGKVSLSGQHEETIVVRAGGHIERVDTIDLGFPIGLDDDIADFISHTLVKLAPGDGIVLYTDGITEAKDTDKLQYGIDKLCKVISQNWQGTAEEIKQAVIADLRRHIGKQKVFDDITLVVLKQEPVAHQNGQQPAATALT
ncbi:MAG: SpoIIE family protein phosphatase [Cyanophyceae cyanobacterium]